MTKQNFAKLQQIQNMLVHVVLHREKV